MTNVSLSRASVPTDIPCFLACHIYIPSIHSKQVFLFLLVNPPDTLTEALTDKTVRAVSVQGMHVHSKLCTVISSTAWIMRHLGVLIFL